VAPCVIAERLSATNKKYKYSGVRVGVKTEKEWGIVLISRKELSIWAFQHLIGGYGRLTKTTSLEVNAPLMHKEIQLVAYNATV